VETDGKYVLAVSGHKCPKGEKYAKQEMEDPRRVLTTSVLGVGLDIKMIPVKTSLPIPKGKLLEVMALVRKIRVERPVQLGEVIQANFAGLGADLVATRPANSPYPLFSKEGVSLKNRA
jgi:CxxC motif-containing protein